VAARDGVGDAREIADYERGGGRTPGELEPRILLAGHNGVVMPLRDRGTRRRRGTVAVGLLATLLPLVGCGATCHPSGGGRCAGPTPIAGSINGPLTLTADGRTLSGFFLCGGRLAVSQSPTQVTLTYIASAVRGGGLTCPTVPLRVYQ